MPEDTQATQSNQPFQRTSLIDALSPSADLVTTLGAENLEPNADFANQDADDTTSAVAVDADGDDAPAETRYDKIPRFQELRTKAEQAQTAREAAEARIAEQESELATLREQYTQDEPLLKEAQSAGYPSVSSYLSAIQEYQASQEREQAAQTALAAKADDLRSQVDAGEISQQLAERMYQMEVFAAQQQQVTKTQQQQSQQMTVNLNRQALAEVTRDVPALSGHKDLLGVLEKTLSNPSGGDTIRTVGREMKAFGDSREQAGYDRAMAELAKKKDPSPLSGTVSDYSPPGDAEPNKRYTLAQALSLGSRKTTRA